MTTAVKTSAPAVVLSGSPLARGQSACQSACQPAVQSARQSPHLSGSLLAVLLVALVAPPPISASGAGAAQDLAALAGIWELDPEESDDPAEVMRRAAAEGERGSGRRGRGGLGGGRGGRGSQGRGGPESGGPRLLALPDLLEIEAGAGELRLVLDERVQILYLDGKEHAREDGRGGKITSVAEFRGGIARVREVRESPMGELEVFRTLQAAGDALVVRTELKMPRRGDPLLLRSVYRRVP